VAVARLVQLMLLWLFKERDNPTCFFAQCVRDVD